MISAERPVLAWGFAQRERFLPSVQRSTFRNRAAACACWCLAAVIYELSLEEVYEMRRIGIVRIFDAGLFD